MRGHCYQFSQLHWCDVGRIRHQCVGRCTCTRYFPQTCGRESCRDDARAGFCFAGVMGAALVSDILATRCDAMMQTACERRTMEPGRHGRLRYILGFFTTETPIWTVELSRVVPANLQALGVVLLRYKLDGRRCALPIRRNAKLYENHGRETSAGSLWEKATADGDANHTPPIYRATSHAENAGTQRR